MDDGTLNPSDQPDDPNRTLVDVFIGNYQLIRMIGSGAMGQVYLARHRKFSQREYAIKLIRSDVTTEAARKRFEREITAMGGLVHPNLIYASDAGVDNDRMYLVMEYVRGQDLQHLIDNRGPMQIPQATEIIRQICAGVAHAHQHGVVHRDIKPANVILSDELEVKVLDLGIASLQSEATSRMTAGGSVMGTAAFIAPELWEDAVNASPASDVYAIGCTAYSLYSGAPPFTGEEHQSIVQIMTAHRQLDPVPLHVLRENFPEELSTLILRSLNKHADRRYQNAAEFAEKLATFSEPLSKDVSLFLGASPPSSYRGPTTTRIGETPSTALGVWAVSVLLLLIAGMALCVAHLGDFVTPAWRLAFGRLGDLQQPRLSGLAFDSVRILVAIPLACYVLARFYPNEVRRTIDLRHWSPAALFARLVSLATFGFLAHYLYQTYWNIDQLPARLAEWAASEDPPIPSEPSQELPSMRWYLGYAIVSPALLATLTLAFPFAWFVASDLSKLRGRLGRLMGSQNETSFPGRLNENLHRFGNDLRVQAGRLLSVCFVATLVLQYNYWLAVFVAKGIRQTIWLRESLLVTIALGCLLTLALLVIAFVYLRGFEATSRLIAALGSVRDEEDLSKISARWLIKTTLLNRASGIGCLSVVLILGHSVWRMNPRAAAAVAETEAVEREPVPKPEQMEPEPPAEQETWLPRHCIHAPDATLVTIQVPGGEQVLYSEVLLRPVWSTADSTSSADDAADTSPITFLLVPQTKAQGPLSFYIMRNKVSARLFGEFERSYPKFVDPRAAERRQQSTSDPTQPIYDVTAIEAMDFASHVCEGKLPTPEQWDTAFGRYLDEATVSKSLSTLEPFLSRAGLDGMLSRDHASDIDISPWGCLEMGSLGYEFTRWDEKNERPFKPHPEAELLRRGWSQFEDDRLSLDAWENSGLKDSLYFGTRPAKEPSDETSFRVVLEQDD